MSFNPKEWLVTVGALAGLGAAAVEIAQYISTARADLTATYQPAPFFLPTQLQEKGPLDTAATEMYKTAKRLYWAYYEKLTPIERQNQPDSLKRPTAPDAFFYGNRIGTFARSYNRFGTLHIQNDGSKASGILQVSHTHSAYYEYEDNNGHLQHGTSTGLFPAGEIVGGQSRDIKLWTSSGFSEQATSVTYAEGRVEAPNTETVSGVWAWVARNIGFFKPTLYALAVWAVIQLLLAQLEKRKRQTE